MIHIVDTWQNLTFAEQVFSGIGLVSNVLFAIYYLISHFLDTDGHGDFDADGALPVLGIRSILAFGMFTGWTAFTLARSGYSIWVAALGGMAAGWLAAWLVWRMLRWMLTWQSSGTLNLHNAIGKNGVVHLAIPSPLNGTGKVHIELQGALRELDAVASSRNIPTGAAIVVVDYEAGAGVLVVSEVPPAD
jgi:membrane protein implicated in regulation of membrane protease activity